jgi:hypothetical protein
MDRVVIDLPESGETEFRYDQADGGLIEITKINRKIQPNKMLSNQTATISFNNMNGYWCNILRSSDKYLKGCQVRYYNGENLKGIFYISKLLEINHPFKIKIDNFIKLNQPICPLLTNGKRGNVIGGVLDDSGWLNKGQCVATRIENGKHHAAAHHLKDVTKVYENGTQISFSFDNNADGHCYILSSSSNDELTFNCKGIMNEEETYMIWNPAWILDRINQMFGDFEIEGISEAAALYEERGYKNNPAILIEGTETWEKFFQKFSINYDSYFVPTNDGKIKLKVDEWENIEPTVSIHSGYIDGFENLYNDENIINSIQRKYFHHFREKTFKYEPEDIQETIKYMPGVGVIELQYHTDDASSFDVAARRLFFLKKPEEKIAFEIFSENFKDLDLGDTFFCKANKGLYKGEKRTYLLLEIKEENEGKVYIAALDIQSRIQGQIILLDENDPNVAILTDETDEECLILM